MAITLWQNPNTVLRRLIKNRNHLFSEPFSVTAEDRKYTVQLELNQPAVLTRAKRGAEGAAHPLVL